MERGFVFLAEGLLVFVGCGSHGRFLSRGGQDQRGSQQARELGAVVGNYTPRDSSALVPSPHSPCPTSLGHGAILHGVTSLELPFLVVKQGPYQNCSLTCAVS